MFALVVVRHVFIVYFYVSFIGRSKIYLAALQLDYKLCRVSALIDDFRVRKDLYTYFSMPLKHTGLGVRPLSEFTPL